MDYNELLLSIGRLYVEASRMQSMIQQLQEQITAKDTVITELQAQSTGATQPQQVPVANLPPELVAAAIPRDESK